MALVVKERILLSTPNGTSEVQLLFGDITKLPVESKVDIVFASAFPGDYTLVPGTMVYALKANLGISMSELAKNKAHNFLRTLNCWVSQPLPDHFPYGRLVCFERMNRNDSLPDQISGIFRAMMPIFNNEDSTVITPLLASGNQGHSEVMVLKAITAAACHWIKAGLPLKCLKITVYAQNLARLSKLHQVLLETFCQLKSVWENNRDEEKLSNAEKKYDVCLSYSTGDAGLARRVCAGLQIMNSSIVIHEKPFSFNHEEIWQEEIFSVMVQSRRIVTILTPAYVENPECLEQYNLALCCNRLTGVEMLAPFYIISVEVFPSYMTIIQYTDCRVRKPGDEPEEKIVKACSLLVTAMDKDGKAITDKADGSAPETTSTKSSESSDVYDVFISYAHRTPHEAVKMYDNLLDIDPNLKVFLDRSELRTGNSWQETLYESMDKAKVVIAFITDSYLKSTVCQEEYNIALARYLIQDGIYFVPLLIHTDMKEIPSMYSGAPLVDMKDPSQRMEEQYFEFAEAVIGWLRALERGMSVSNIFCQPGVRKSRISLITTRWREKDFNKRFTTKNKKYVEMVKTSAEETVEDQAEKPAKAKTTKQVVFSCTKNSFSQAVLLARYLTEDTKVKVKCEFMSSPEDAFMKTRPNMQLLDSADMVVVILSDDYMTSSQHCHELHIALCRQRMTKDKRVVYIIQSNHFQRRPIYSHLFPNTITIEDEIWRSVSWNLRSTDIHTKVKVPGLDLVDVFCSSEERQALSVACLDIVDKLLVGSQAPGGSGMPTNIVNLVNLMDNAETVVSTSGLLTDFSTVLGKPKDSNADGTDTESSSEKQDTENSAEKQETKNSAEKQETKKSAEKQETKNSAEKQDTNNSAEKQDTETTLGKDDTETSAGKQEAETSAGEHRVENTQRKQGTEITDAGKNPRKTSRKSSACQIT